MRANGFINMVRTLRQQEEVVLYGQTLKIPQREAVEVMFFLEQEYRLESVDYPDQPPEFHNAAALWAARTVYLAAQLLLYREDKAKDLPALFPAFEEEITPAAMVSADLCLRFLPDVVEELAVVDKEDPLLEVLHPILRTWHYSGMARLKDAEEVDLQVVTSDPCLLQLYANRVIDLKKQPLAELPVLNERIRGNLGAHVGQFWNELNTTNS